MSRVETKVRARRREGGLVLRQRSEPGEVDKGCLVSRERSETGEVGDGCVSC